MRGVGHVLWVRQATVYGISAAVMALLLPLARRKSNIVKEMEKMKSKREEKRAQFSEIRNKRAQVMYDLKPPFWKMVCVCVKGTWQRKRLLSMEGSHIFNADALSM